MWRQFKLESSTFSACGTGIMSSGSNTSKLPRSALPHRTGSVVETHNIRARLERYALEKAGSVLSERHMRVGEIWKNRFG